MTDAPQLRRNPTTGQVFIYEPGATEWREVQARRNEETGEVFVYGQGDADWRSLGPLARRDQGGALLPGAETPAPAAPRTAPQAPALSPDLLSAITGAPTAQSSVPRLTPPQMPPAVTAPPSTTGNPLLDAMMPAAPRPADASQMPAVPADRAAMIAQTMGAGVDPRTVPMPGIPQQPRQPQPERAPQPAADLGRRVAMGAVEPFASIPEFVDILAQDVIRSRYGSALDALPALEQEAIELRQIIATADDSTEGAMRRGAAEMRLRNVEGELTRALRMVEQDTATLERRPTAESGWIFSLGDRLRNAVSGAVGETDPQFDDRFVSQLAYGGGNMAGMMATALLGGPVTGSVAVAGQGAAMNTSQVYQEALASGASQEDALLAARFAGVIGSSEIIPIQRALDVLPARLRNAVAGRVSRHIANIMQSSGEEAAQEALAQVANNILASSIYDPERGWSEGVTEAAAVGAVLGGATGALGTAINRPGQGVDPVTAGGEENRGGEPPRDVPPTPQATPTPPADPATALLNVMAPRRPPAAAATPVPPPEPETPRLPESAPVGQAGQRPAVPTPPPAEERPAVGAGRAPVAGEGLDPAEWNVIPGVDAQGNETGRTFMENSRTGEVIPRAEYERRLGQQAEAQAPAAEPAPPPAQPPAADPVAQAMAGETAPSAPDASGNALVQALTPAPAPAPTGMTIDVGGRQYPVDSYEMASRMVRQAIERGDFGASDMDGTPLIRDAQGNVVARVAYNGRVFPGAEYQAGVAPLYDPLSREDQAAIAGGQRAVEPPQPGRTPAPPVADAQTPQQAARELEREARRRFGTLTRPVITALRGAGIQIDPTGMAAGDLRSMGVTPQTAPGLYRRGGVMDLDNIVASEFPALQEIVRADQGTGYFDLEDLKAAIADEASGNPRLPAELREALDMRDIANREAELRARVNDWADENAITALTDAEKADMVEILLGDPEYDIEDAAHDVLVRSEAAFLGEPAPSETGRAGGDGAGEGDGIPFDANDPRGTRGGQSADPFGEATERSDGPQSEQTPEGEQLLTPGVAPITDRDRLESQMNRPMQGGRAPADMGLFDTGARAQTDMFDAAPAPREPDSVDRFNAAKMMGPPAEWWARISRENDGQQARDVLERAGVGFDRIGRPWGDIRRDDQNAILDAWDGMVANPAPRDQNAELRDRLEGDETESRRQGRADFAEGKPRRLPPYIDPTDSVAAMGWYTGWDEANLAQEVPGVQPARDLPDLAPRDRRQAWNAMSPAERETLLRSMGGFDKRDGSLTGGGKNAIQKNWQDLSAGARDKIETAWREMEDAETFLAPQDTQEGGDRDGEVQGQGGQEAVDAAPAPPPAPAGGLAEDREPDPGPAEPEPAGEADGDGNAEIRVGTAWNVYRNGEWFRRSVVGTAPGGRFLVQVDGERTADIMTAEDVMTARRVDEANNETRQREDARRDAEQAEADAAQAEREDLDGFDADMTPMQRGRVIATLDKQMRWGWLDNKILTRREAIKRMVEEGWEMGVMGSDGEAVVRPSDQAYYAGQDLTQTGLAYARHLIAQRDAAPAAEPTAGQAEAAATVRLARRLMRDVIDRKGPKTNQALMNMAAEEFGGTIGEGAFSPKDAYEALELAVNLGIQKVGAYHPGQNRTMATKIVGELADIVDALPTQTRRDMEQEAFQQFSTPPAYGYAVNWIANIPEGARVLEPSAGNGGIAVFAGNVRDARVDVNELSERRVPSLEALDFDRVSTENAEQIGNIWANDPTRRYDVVVMNPPFSAAGTRGTANTSATGARHIEQALALLKPGGRLVAIMGHTFRPSNSRVKPFFDKLGRTATLRANVEVNGNEVYRKYGTSYDSRVLVIDKIPQEGDAEPVAGRAESIADLIRMLEDVRNDTRYTTGEAATAEPAGADPDGAGSRAPAAPGRGDGRPAREPEQPSQPDDLGSEAEGGRGNRRPAAADGGDPRPAGDAESGAGQGERGRADGGDGAAGSRGRAAGDSGRPTVRLNDAQETRVEDTAGGFAKYRPTRVRIEGAKEHPMLLVESSAMASVNPPKPNYDLKLPAKMVKDGLLSEAQLETVVYAGAAHADMLPADGDRPAKRKGFFIGDGTGVGKTREIAGIIADNWAQGRTKHILISKDKKLLKSARRDFDNVGMKSVPLADLGGVKPTGAIPRGTDGVMFATYNTLARTPAKDQKSRIDQLVEWVGADFDGTIIFDEAHLAGNALPMKGKMGTRPPSKTALAVVDLQRALPNARVVYASATGATEVYNLAYADRLGLWGPGTPFPNVMSFVTQIDAGGIAAMEVVARDMKQMGVYMARSLSFEGVEYAKVEHELTPSQRQMYDAAAQAWQGLLSNLNKVVQDYTDGGSTQRSIAMRKFWGAHQRFFQQVLTSMQMPTVIRSIKADLAAGRAPVIQIVNTNDAATNRAIGKMEEGDTLDDIDITPREDIIQYLQNSFPIEQWEEYADEDGNIRTRPVVDSQGNPVFNAEAVALRDQLIEEIAAMQLPGNPLDLILETFGAENVAEVTGRTKRIVTKNGKKVQESRSQSKTLAEASEFMAGKREVLVFSDAGGTGMDFHADKGVKNKARRAHYVLQAGWRADRAIQGFGRTHRTNQTEPPIYKLAGTNLSGHKRFTSSIARRLDQLGALTKGQSDTGGGGMFSATDNLENVYAENAVMALMREVYAGNLEGWGPAQLETELGLQLAGEQGFSVSRVPPVPQFLNRLLNTTIDRQNQLFDRFIYHMEAAIETAIERGEFTAGIEQILHDGAVLAETKEAYRAQDNAAVSEYQMIRVRKRTQVTPFGEHAKLASTTWKRDRDTGTVYAFRPSSTRTAENGDVIPTYSRWSPTDRTIIDRPDYRMRYEAVDADVAEAEWQRQIDEAPPFVERSIHMVTGALLPIWDRLPKSSPKIVRITLDDGRTLLGRQIPDNELVSTMERLGVGAPQIDMSAAEVLEAVMGGRTVHLSSGHRIARRRVGGEARIEIIPDQTAYEDTRPGGTFQRAGFQIERIGYKARAFIPNSEAGAKVLQSYMQGKSIINVTMQRDQARLDVFYSPLQAALDSAKQARAPAQDWKAIISKLPGVKRAEIEWMGVEDWLDLQEGQVTREALADFVREQQIHISEVISVETTGNPFADDEIADAQGGFAPAFESYTEDGGTNYREMLLTVPNLHESGKNAPPAANLSEVQRIQAQMDALIPDGGSPADLSDAQYREWKRLQGQRDMARAADVARRREGSKRPFVQASHFSEPNIVVHARVKDRTGPNGERVLFVEEIQSDLASKWREASENPEVTARRRELDEKGIALSRDLEREWQAMTDRVAEIGALPKHGQVPVHRLAIREIMGVARPSEPALYERKNVEDFVKDVWNDDAAMAVWERISKIIDERSAIERERLRLGTARTIDPSTPDTPFKEEHTYTLMVKRLLREAAAQGYDRLAWTPGYMQAERWNAAAQSVVEGVRWGSDAEVLQGQGNAGGKLVSLDMGDGMDTIGFMVDETGKIIKSVYQADSLIGKTLPQLIGPSLAQDILTQPSGTVSGQKITFPDSGYAIAYDQQIKRAVDKLAKGTGARVEQVRDLPDMGADVRAETTRDQRIKASEMSPSALLDLAESVGAFSDTALAAWRNAPLAQQRTLPNKLMQHQLDKMFPRDVQVLQEGNPVWSITITDDLRAKAMLPQPILQQGRQRVTQGPYAPYRETMAESRVFKTLRAELDSLGLRNVELQFDPFYKHQGSVYADHFGRIAITIGNTLNPRWTMGHEAIHIYKHLGVFTREEWALLSETAEAEWMDRYNIAARYPDLTRDEQIEEAVAEAFGEVYDNRSNAFISEPLVLQALRKIANFLKAIRNWARGMGMQTSGDILNALARGAYARKAQVNARPAGWQSQTDRLLRHQRKPGMLQENRGALHLPDRRVWETLFEANDLSIRERLRATKGALRDTSDRVRTRIQDRMLPMRRAIEEVERVMGAPMPEDLNVYLAEEMYSGRAGHKLDIIEQQYVKPIMNLIGKTKGVTAETVGRYLYARHAVERNERIAQINPDMPDGGSGMSSEEAAMILAEIEGSDAAPAYREIAKKIDALREWSIQLRVDAGLMSEFQADAWRAAYKTYVPLKGWAETENADAEFDVTGIGRGYNVRGQESRMAMGRRTEAFNPLIAALTQAQEAVVRSEKNLVGQHLYRLAKDLPSKNLWSVKRAETRRVFNETTGLVEERSFSPITLLQAQNEFAVKIDGQEHRVMLHDPRLARSMGLIGTDAMIGPIRILSHFSRYFSTMNTMLNPTFLPKNVMRDMLTATINVRRFPNSARIQRRMLRDWPKALAGAYRGLGGKADTKWAQYFREFSEAGGKVSFWVIENPESSQGRLERMARRRSGPVGMAASFATWRISENPALAAIERINLAADNAVRLAAFVAAREEGYTIQEAASLGKNLTVNFNRRGEWGSVINAFYTFSNAGFQGTHMILKAMKDSAYARRAALALVAVGFLLDQANSYLSDEDEDGQLFYDKIPDYTHAMNAVLMMGTGPDTADTSLRVPLPYGYNVFPYIGNRLSRLERGVTSERNVIGDITLLTFTSFSPISGADLLTTITPTIASPLVERATNRNFFGGPIYPQFQQPGLPDSQFHTQGATQAAILTADAVNRWTGGTYAESGFIDVSPDSIDHIAGFLGGGAGRFIGRSANFVVLAMNDTPGDISTNDVPFLRDYYVPPQGWWSRSLYWDRRRELEAAHNAARRYEAAGDPVPDSIRWRADLWRNDGVRLEAHRLYNGTVGRTQNQEAAVLLLNSAYVRAMARNTPYNGESIFDALRP